MLVIQHCVKFFISNLICMSILNNVIEFQLAHLRSIDAHLRCGFAQSLGFDEENQYAPSWYIHIIQSEYPV